MTTKKVYVDTKTESYPVWLAESKYDKSKSTRENYVDNAIRPFQGRNIIYSLAGREKVEQLEAAKRDIEQTKERKKQKQKKNWRDYVAFIN